MTETTLTAILKRIDIFLSQHPDMSEATFGLKAIGSTALVTRIREGRDITTRKLDMLLNFMANYKEETPAEASQNNKPKPSKKRKK